MSDRDVLEARRLVRELLRSGQDPETVLRSVIDELALDIETVIRVAVRHPCDMTLRAETDSGMELASSFVEPYPVAIRVRPASTRRTMTVTWAEPFDPPLPSKDVSVLDEALRRRILGNTLETERSAPPLTATPRPEGDYVDESDRYDGIDFGDD